MKPILMSFQSRGYSYLKIEVGTHKIYFYDKNYFDEVLSSLLKVLELTNLQICELLDNYNNKNNDK